MNQDPDITIEYHKQKSPRHQRWLGPD